LDGWDVIVTLLWAGRCSWLMMIPDAQITLEKSLD
jgi:hypothetical protein